MSNLKENAPYKKKDSPVKIDLYYLLMKRLGIDPENRKINNSFIYSLKNLMLGFHPDTDLVDPERKSMLFTPEIILKLIQAGILVEHDKNHSKTLTFSDVFVRLYGKQIRKLQADVIKSNVRIDAESSKDEKDKENQLSRDILLITRLIYKYNLNQSWQNFELLYKLKQKYGQSDSVFEFMLFVYSKIESSSREKSDNDENIIFEKIVAEVKNKHPELKNVLDKKPYPRISNRQSGIFNLLLTSGNLEISRIDNRHVTKPTDDFLNFLSIVFL